MTHRIAKAITSLGSVIFVMLLSLSAMVFFSHTLFTTALPEEMAPWEKTLAAWLMALGLEATVLISTCNVKHLHPRIPVAMAICSGFILLYFVQAFDMSQSALIISQRWFIGLLIAFINFNYSDLFYKKWIEFSNTLELPNKLIDLESKVVALQSALNEAQSKLNEMGSLKQFKAQITKELTCPHCHLVQENFGRAHAHKGWCQENPKRKALLSHQVNAQ